MSEYFNCLMSQDEGQSLFQQQQPAATIPYEVILPAPCHIYSWAQKKPHTSNHVSLISQFIVYYHSVNINQCCTEQC